MTVDGWYRALGPRASFAFEVRRGVIVRTAPYGRFLRGLSWAAAWERLDRSGFVVERMGPRR